MNTDTMHPTAAAPAAPAAAGAAEGGNGGRSPAEPDAPAGFTFDNSYARELDGLYVDWQPARQPAPRLLRLNAALADELGLDPGALEGAGGAEIFSGNRLPAGARPIAQAYAGHQFGGFSPQLGDGRALLVGELIDRHGRRRDIALKGSGRTPFSRGGDGNAAVGPVLREYLIGEAMHALGIPTTRALAAVATGATVHREAPLPGAVLTRVAASHLRVGTFQFVAARGDVQTLARLADYAIRRHYPALVDTDDRALGLLAAVRDAQASLIARWMLVGFIHGVMNTDNSTISGETIDYGPCAFMDAYDPATVFSSIDVQGRYAYANQPAIGGWNLARLAESLLPLIDADRGRAVERATQTIASFDERLRAHWVQGMRAKLGLHTARDDDAALADGFLGAMQEARADFTLAFRHLSRAIPAVPAASTGDAPAPAGELRALFDDPRRLDGWLGQWRARLDAEPMDPKARAAAMDDVNPLYIPRNHLVEQALVAAFDRNDLEPFERMLGVLARPFEPRAGLEAYASPAPDGNPGFRTFCGT
ncbi:MAG: YdiU family protein [Lautropia sp.]